MTVKNIVEQNYANLCAKLGDLIVKRDAYEADINTLKLQLDALQTLTPDLQKIDTVLAAERARLTNGQKENQEKA